MQYVVLLEVDDDFIDGGDDSIERVCSRVNDLLEDHCSWARDLLEDHSNTYRANIRPLSEILAC